MSFLPVDFTLPMDIVLVGVIFTPIAAWLASKLKVGRVPEACAVAFLVLSMALLFPLYATVREEGPQIVSFERYLPPLGACLEIDMLGLFMAFLFTFLGIVSAIYSIRYMEHDTGLTEYYTLLLLMVAGMVGVSFAGDFFTLFVFWEIMSISSYALVAFRKERWEPVEAGLKYIIMSAAGSASLLLAMSFLYGMTGTLNFAYIAKGFQATPMSMWMAFTLILMVIGFGIKAAIAPFHTWLPDAHPAAPSPISSMLSGVVIKSGAYGLIRVLSLIFFPLSHIWQPILVGLALLTMFTGNLMALLQKDLKRLLAFSSIAQMGYIVFGFSMGTINGLTGSLFHIMNHAIMKGLLFMCAGAFLYAAGSRDLEVLRGVGKKMRVSGLIFAVAALAIAGLPGLNGFMSEVIWILRAGIEVKMYLPTALMVFNMLLSVVYYLRAIRIIVLEEPSEELREVKEVPFSMLLPMGVLGALCLIIGLFPSPFVNMANQAARAALDGAGYISALMGGASP